MWFLYIHYFKAEFGFQLNGQKLRVLDDWHCELIFSRHVNWILNVRITSGAEAHASNVHFSTVIFLPSCQTNYFM